ncbi:MAG: JAB domain-containing protein, partial [Thermoanaerobaculia bacterium]
MEDRYATLQLEILKTDRIPDGSRNIAKLLQDWGFGKQPQECFWVISTDAAGHIRTVVEVARGGHAEVEIHIPAVLTAVLVSGGTVFSAAHNHPTISVMPS